MSELEHQVQHTETNTQTFQRRVIACLENVTDQRKKEQKVCFVKHPSR